MISGFRRDVDEICVFWGITQRRVVIVYRRFGTTYRSHLHGSCNPSRKERKPATYKVDSVWEGGRGVAIVRRDDSQWNWTRVRDQSRFNCKPTSVPLSCHTFPITACVLSWDKVLYSLSISVRVLSAIMSQVFPHRRHFYICCRQGWPSAIKTRDNRSATNPPDVISAVISVVRKF
jgi:hypothetical protein